MDLSSIGGYIRQYRVAANVSQDKLAECSGVSSKHIGVLERSERSPSLETLIRIANALNISADMLLCDVLETEVGIKQTMLSKKIGNLSREQQRDIIDVVDDDVPDEPEVPVNPETPVPHKYVPKHIKHETLATGNPILLLLLALFIPLIRRKQN